MDMISSIASASISLGSSRLLTQVNVAMMSKVLDTAESQGQAIVEMMETAAPSVNQLDVYA